jgi:copper chaperone CopZ
MSRPARQAPPLALSAMAIYLNAMEPSRTSPLELSTARAIFVTVALLVGTLGFGCRPETSTAEAADGARYVLGIEGMSCAVSCAPQVKASLEGIDGVKSVEVSFEEKRAVVQMAAGHELTQAVCDKSFGNKGYFVSSFAREDALAGAPGAAAAPAPAVVH